MPLRHIASDVIDGLALLSTRDKARRRQKNRFNEAHSRFLHHPARGLVDHHGLGSDAVKSQAAQGLGHQGAGALVA